jgi:hypothetical protein
MDACMHSCMLPPAACPQAGLSTTLRCAGGWVRDKLMGRSSLDIDIALDDLLGREFADRVNEYLKAHVRQDGEAGGQAGWLACVQLLRRAGGSGEFECGWAGLGWPGLGAGLRDG